MADVQLRYEISKGKQSEPVSLQFLASEYQKGAVNDRTRVWCKGMSNWTAIKKCQAQAWYPYLKQILQPVEGAAKVLTLRYEISKGKQSDPTAISRLAALLLDPSSGVTEETRVWAIGMRSWTQLSQCTDQPWFEQLHAETIAIQTSAAKTLPKKEVVRLLQQRGCDKISEARAVLEAHPEVAREKDGDGSLPLVSTPSVKVTNSTASGGGRATASEEGVILVQHATGQIAGASDDAETGDLLSAALEAEIDGEHGNDGGGGGGGTTQSQQELEPHVVGGRREGEGLDGAREILQPVEVAAKGLRMADVQLRYEISKGKQSEPVSLQFLASEYQKGAVNDRTRVWCKGMSNWTAIKKCQAQAWYPYLGLTLRYEISKGKQSEPVSLQFLASEYQKGAVNDRTRVWCKGMSNWTAIKKCQAQAWYPYLKQILQPVEGAAKVLTLRYEISKGKQSDPTAISRLAALLLDPSSGVTEETRVWAIGMRSWTQLSQCTDQPWFEQLHAETIATQTSAAKTLPKKEVVRLLQQRGCDKISEARAVLEAHPEVARNCSAIVIQARVRGWLGRRRVADTMQAWKKKEEEEKKKNLEIAERMRQVGAAIFIQRMWRYTCWRRWSLVQGEKDGDGSLPLVSTPSVKVTNSTTCGGGRATASEEGVILVQHATGQIAGAPDDAETGDLLGAALEAEIDGEHGNDGGGTTQSQQELEPHVVGGGREGDGLDGAREILQPVEVAAKGLTLRYEISKGKPRKPRSKEAEVHGEHSNRVRWLPPPRPPCCNDGGGGTSQSQQELEPRAARRGPLPKGTHYIL